MGRGKAEQPQRISEKLKQIRNSLGLTQEEMAKAIGQQDFKVYRGYIGSYEIGERVPTLLVTMAYARIANIPMETLCDDQIELPERLKG